MADQVTIYDVAERAGVSVATVSRVINEPSRVAEARRQKVLDAIQALNFVPKAEAVINARKSYKKIAVLAPFFTSPSFMERLRGVSYVLASVQFELVLYSINTSKDLTDYISALVAGNRVDGLIALCVKFDDQQRELLSKANFPVCMVENDDDLFDCVVVPNFQGGQKAAECLFKKGVKSFGFIGELSKYDYAVPATEERLQGFEAYLLGKKIKMKKEDVLMGAADGEALDAMVEQYLSREQIPQGIFCSSDVIALHVSRAAHLKGIRVPQDLKVIGFDDIDMASYMGLSTVGQGLENSGRMAAEMVLSRIKDPGRDVRKVLAALSMRERGTSE